VVAFALANVALAAAVEKFRAEWRDPEYACRVNRLREWKATAPDRPLVLFFGSSRTQMGICPAAMGFPDESGSPLVYNFGYRGARPVGMWLQVTRLLDDGPRPEFVVVQLALNDIGIMGSADARRPAAAGPVRHRPLGPAPPMGGGPAARLGRAARADPQ
jgi:hypothetical protein